MRLVAILAQRQDVKHVKTYLDESGYFDKAAKIKQVTQQRCEELGVDFQAANESYELRLKDNPTSEKDAPSLDVQAGVLPPEIINRIIPIYADTDFLVQPSRAVTSTRNPVLNALSKWLNEVSSALLETLSCDHDGIISSFPLTFCAYPPLLLLPAHAFKAEPWPRILEHFPSQTLQNLWKSMALETGMTHIAINAPIPRRNNAGGSDRSSADLNILRSPSNLTFLYGRLPESPKNISQPTSQDLDKALWSTTSQNRIRQVWAPQYTMFSRGNIREKTRILSLPSVVSCTKEAGGSTVVDLFAGIGYFSFSYAKAGASLVLGWEINPWSIEGFRRGVKKNKWLGGVVQATRNSVYASSASNYDFQATIASAKTMLEGRAYRKASSQRPPPLLMMFPHSNEHSVEEISALREDIPPVRHVNLGLLPSSSAAIELAVRALDPVLGGWLHIHENIATHEHDERTASTLQETRLLVAAVRAEAADDHVWTVELEHVEKVKTYAPGVVHCVLDIRITRQHT